MWMLVWIVVFIFAIYSLFINSNGKVAKRFGVYTIPGVLYPLKLVAFHLLITIRKRVGSGSSAGYGTKSHSSAMEMDSVKKLSDHEHAIDAAYFNGYSMEQPGWYIGAGIQRRHHLKAESVMLLRVPELDNDILEWPHGPATDVDMDEPRSWTAGGLKYEILEPMKQWRVTFEGQLKQRRAGTLRDVKYDLIWTANTPCFDMDTDMDTRATCAAIATEPWSRDFFERLKLAHQTHYEQYGVLEGDIQIDGLEKKYVKFLSMRDRSYGLYRDWLDFHRYILQYFAFEDGTCVALHLVSLPVLMTHLVVGFVTNSNTGEIEAIRYCDKKLWQVAELPPIPPDDFELNVATTSGRKLNLQVKLIEKPYYYCGFQWQAKLWSVLCEASLSGDGIQQKSNGRGMCEFEYRNNTGRTDGRKPLLNVKHLSSN